jgi:hypothetical protein
VLTPERPIQPNDVWAMDFVSDSIDLGRKLRVVTVLDPATNVSPFIHVSYSITGENVANKLTEHALEYGYPNPHFSPIDFFLGLRQFGGLLEMLEASNRVY